jgi:hypothetical protein
VLRRLEQHPLQEHAVGGLDLCTAGNRHPGRTKALRQIVSDAFKLAQPEQPRLASMLWRLVEATHPVRSHKRLRQLPLEALDLNPQGATRGALIYFRNRRAWSGDALP